MTIDISFTSMRSRFVYGLTGSLTTLDMELPHRFVDPIDETVGGRRISSAGVGASFIVRRDEIYNVPLRFREADWPIVLDLIEFGQTEAAFQWYPDADDLNTFFDVFLHSPEAGESVSPTRNAEYPYIYELTIQLRVSPVLIPAPVGYPECKTLVPAGSYIDLTIGNHNQVGDEIVEIWLQRLAAGSGGLENPAPGTYRATTDFSEFPVASGLPSDLVLIGDSGGSYWDTFEIANDAEAQNFLRMGGASATGQETAIYYNPWGQIWPDDFEVLALVWIQTRDIGASVRGLGVGAAINEPSAGSINIASALCQSAPGDYEAAELHAISDSTPGTNGNVDLLETEVDGVWAWHRYRRETVGVSPGKYRHRINIWYGDPEDEPAGWLVDVTPNPQVQPDGPGYAGWGIIDGHLGPGVDDPDQHRVGFFSITTDWVNYPPLEKTPTVSTSWELIASLPVNTLATQSYRIDDLITSTEYKIALRYNRNGLYNPGAEDTNDPDSWPSISRCQTTTTLDPPTLNSLVWSRNSAVEEQIELTITPDSLSFDINVYRALVTGGVPGAYSLIDTIAGPHAATITYQDTTVIGERRYSYVVTTQNTLESPFSNALDAWVGPAAIPVISYFFYAALNNYTVGFITTDSSLDTELWDDMVDGSDPGFPSFEGMSLEVTALAGETEIERDSPFVEEDPDFEWLYKLRHKITQFTVTDYGEFTDDYIGDWPDGGVNPS